jgi:arylsulfatase A-like enzyme
MRPGATTLSPPDTSNYTGRLDETPYAPGGIQGAAARRHRLCDLPEAHLREMMAHYYALVSLVDTSVGHVLDALDRLGLDASCR